MARGGGRVANFMEKSTMKKLQKGLREFGDYVEITQVTCGTWGDTHYALHKPNGPKVYLCGPSVWKETAEGKTVECGPWTTDLRQVLQVVWRHV